MLRRSAGLALAGAITLLASCSGSTPTAPSVSPRAPSSTPSPLAGEQGGSGNTYEDPYGLDLQHVLTLGEAWAATANVRYLPMYRQPGRAEASFAFDTQNPVGVQAPLLVEDAKRIDGKTWLRLLLPIRPNGHAAWVKEKDVSLAPRKDRIVVDLSRRMLWHYQDGKLVGRFTVGVGTPSTPTATGTFYTYERVPMSDPNGPYGILAFGLSGFSPVISDWPGGGRMAMHGTPYESNKGQAVSHGCVRVWNGDMQSLVHLPLGTPVIIRP